MASKSLLGGSQGPTGALQRIEDVVLALLLGAMILLAPLQILLRGVDHAQRRRVEQRREGRDVDLQRVDEHETLTARLLPGDLHQRQLREIGAFTVELGVERVARELPQRRDDLLEVSLIVDPLVNEWFALGQVSSR